MTAKLVLPLGLAGLTEGELEMKGYFDLAAAEVGGLGYYPLSFADPMGFGHEDQKRMEDYGRPCCAEATLVVVPKVTLEHMRRAVEHLAARGYFEQFVPLSEGAMHASLAAKSWPPERRESPSHS